MFRYSGLVGPRHERRSAAVFRHSRARAGDYPREHLAGYVGMQAGVFAGCYDLYHAKPQPAPIIEAASWSAGPQLFLRSGRLTKAPIAVEAVHRIGELFEIERAINGKTPEQRVVVHHEKSKPLVADLEAWLRK